MLDMNLYFFTQLYGGGEEGWKLFDYCEKRKGKKKVIAQTVVPLYLFRVQEFVKSKEGREIMNNMKMKWEDFFF